jgi:hypothetical protein
MIRQSVFGTVILILCGLDLTLAVLGIARYPALFIQHGAWIFVVQLVGVLLVYGGAAAALLRLHGPAWQTISKYGVVFGCITGGLELLSLAIETRLPAWTHLGIFSVGVMVSLFVLWGIAGGWAARATGSTSNGVWTAVTSAALCMLVAVAAGFVVEFFIATPDVGAIQTWQEFKRSGWTDARAFGVANTLDSGFTHLLIAPVVASLFGLGGSLIGRVRTRPPQL